MHILVGSQSESFGGTIDQGKSYSNFLGPYEANVSFNLSKGGLVEDALS